MTDQMIPPQPQPVGQRPACLQCQRELRPAFRENLPGWGAVASPGYIPGPCLYGDALRQWKKENPGWRRFTGHYGGYGDDRFCGLNCGYKWAVRHSRPSEIKSGLQSGGRS